MCTLRLCVRSCALPVCCWGSWPVQSQAAACCEWLWRRRSEPTTWMRCSAGLSPLHSGPVDETSYFNDIHAHNVVVLKSSAILSGSLWYHIALLSVIDVTESLMTFTLAVKCIAHTPYKQTAERSLERWHWQVSRQRLLTPTLLQLNHTPVTFTGSKH